MERVRIGFARLFEVRLMHHFWLDDAATVFDAIADQTVRTERLLTYDVRRLLAVAPSRATRVAVAGLRGAFRETGLGFVVAVPDDSVVPLDLTFEFFLTVVAPDYPNYTSLSLRPQRLVDVTDPAPPRTIHRFKENVPVLSNLTGASRGTGATKRLYLSQEYPSGADDGVESLFLAGNSLRQLTGDPPAAPFHVLGPKSAHPVYVHQGDVPAIAPPPGSTGAPARGVELTGDTPPDTAAVVSVSVRGAGDSAYNVVGTNGRLRTPAPVFEVHFRNRWTTWRYRDKGDGSVTSTGDDPLPLTHFGSAGTKRKPPVDAIAVELDPGDPQRIIRLMSDIYV